MPDTKTSLSGVVDIIYATSENSSFEHKNGFLSFKIRTQKTDNTEAEAENKEKEAEAKKAEEDKKEDGTQENSENNDKKPEEKNDYDKVIITDNNDGTETREYNRVFLHRAFPFENPDEYISIVDKNAAEIAIIRDITDVGESEREYIRSELDRKYYTPKIKKILSMKERFGFSYWKVETDSGEKNFTMQDTYRGIIKLDMGRVFLTDVDGNRYDIPDVEALDRLSYKKIELYL